MSCDIQLTATLEGIKEFLESDKFSQNENDTDYPRNTIQNFKTAISPTGEVLVFAKSTQVLLCGSKWDSSVTDGAKVKYSPVWNGHINCKPGEEITTVVCLPFFSQGQSFHSCADWTCIVLGFSTGCFRFYTESMEELACSILHEEPITDIKCHCPSTTLRGKTQNLENSDVYVLYKTVICVLNGTLLSQTLRSKRNNLAKGSFRAGDTEAYTSLDFKKYSFVKQEEITDACFLGQTASSCHAFDHLVTASLVGGFACNYKPSPPQTSLIITTGRRPFVGFHYTLEGGNSSVLTDVALAVASKIKSSVTATLPDWFSFGNKKAAHSDKPKEVTQDFAESLQCRFGLCDLWRQGQSVIVSPDGVFSAVSDSLGRVILIDNATGIAHRLWKGFRDAQCGFLQVQEDIHRMKRTRNHTPKPQPRQALFIVIYAPKKGLIEIFTVQNGRRVTSFKVTKFGRLLYSPRGHATSNISVGGFCLGQNQVLFVSEEGLKEFIVPFHCALAEDNSKMARDLHILKKIKMLLKMENNSSKTTFVEEIEKCAKELKTDEVRLQAIESMVTYKNTTLEAFKAVLKVFLEALQSEDRSEAASRKIITFAETIHNLLLFYDFVLNINDQPPKYETVLESVKKTDSLFEELRMPEKELDILLKFINQITEIQGVKKHVTKVAFEEKKSTKLGQYLSCFDFESFLNTLENEKQEEKKESQKCQLNLKLSGKEDRHGHLGKIFFQGLFNSFDSLDEWKRHLESCGLNPMDVALCLLSYWCNKNTPDEFSSELLFLVELLKAICSLSDPDVVSVEYNNESPLWLRLRAFIAGNSSTIRGLFAALCCRSVTIFVEQERELSLKQLPEKKMSKSSEGESAFSHDWETISKDTCQWDILITQLQDVALLNAVLNLTFRTQNNLPEVPFDFDYQCLTSIQASGMGRVAELVAKWLVQFGFEPLIFINKKDLEFQGAAHEEKDVEKEKCNLVSELDKANEARNCEENSNLALDYLALLKSRFPYSLTSSSLLGNMCWEYIAHWFKNISEINYLESAVRYLEVIPASGIKYGISYLSWNTYLEQKFAVLAKIINKIGKVPRDKLCVQEIGLRNDQVPVFLKIITDYIKIMLSTDEEEKPDFGTNREAIWQNSSTSTASSLVSIALSQPIVNSDLLLFQYQFASSLLLMAGLNIKHAKVFSCLFDVLEKSDFALSGKPPLNSHYHSPKLKDSRMEFLKKCLTAAVQTVEVIEYIPPVSSDDPSETVPSTSLKVEEYKKWLRLLFELGGMWTVSLDEMRRHQICELYYGGFDRLAEEVIPSVNETDVLASQLLVLGGKRLKYLIQDSVDFYKELTRLSGNLSDWLYTVDLENFTYHGTSDDIEVLMRYVAKWLPEGHSDQKLAVAVIESLSFLKNKNT